MLAALQAKSAGNGRLLSAAQLAQKMSLGLLLVSDLMFHGKMNG